MLSYKKILDGIDGMFYIVRDEEGKIIQTQPKEKKDFYQEILKKKSSNFDDIYDAQNDAWYKYIVKTVEEKNKKYTIEYLINNTETKRSEIDEMTKTYSKDACRVLINKYISYAINCKESFCILVLDVDNFKKANDTYGHMFGDHVLQCIGETLNKDTRKNVDIVGRMGGDEFIVVLKDITMKKATERALNIIDNISVLKFENFEDYTLTVSVGMYYIGKKELKELLNYSTEKVTELLIHRSDMAMYKSKEQVKNQLNNYISM